MPPVTSCGADSPAQRRAHALAARQSTLQVDAHSISQLALAAHVTLLLSPTEMLQLAPSHVTFELDSVATAQSLAGAQRMLHEEPQA